MDQNLKQKSINAFGWKLAQSLCTLGTSFVIQIILARLLLPEDFGIVAITTVFMTLANTIIETGFSSSVIQNAKLNQKQLSSVFFANLALSFLIYLLLFLIAPIVSSFYSEPILTPILRVQGLRVLFSALYTVQAALLNRRMEFKKIFISYFIGAVVQGVMGIGMAMLGFGVWALVFSTIINYAVAGIIIMFLSKWWPSLFFSYNMVKSALSFGSKVLLVDIIQKVFYNIRSLAMGKVYSADVLGLFNKGFQFPSTAMTVVDGSFIAVAFTSLSKLQHDLKKLLSALRSYIQIMTYLTMPIMLGMFMVATPMVKVLLTNKWMESVPYLQIICIIYIFKPLLVKSQAFNAIGRSDISMKLNTAGIGLSIVLILASMMFSPYVMIMSEMVSTIALHVGFAIASKKYFSYSYAEQIADFCSPIIPSAGMCVVIYLVSLLKMPDVLSLFVEVVVGILIYFVISKVTRNKCFDMLMGFVREKLRRSQTI